jgi:hypothetical protein
VLFGFIEAGSPAQGLATVLEIIWEIGILGLLLIFRGFQPGAAASLVSRSENHDASAVDGPSSVAPAMARSVA